jgi:NAD+ synthase (glutamine-hydrolysing)
MRIAVLQLDLLVGDVSGNTAKILRAATSASAAGAELAVCSELAVVGYPPRDLLLRRDLVGRQADALDELAAAAPLPLIVGFAEPNPAPSGNPLFNSAALVSEGRIRAVRRKALLPTYDVFDEHRYFEPFIAPQGPIEVNRRRIAVLVCEDIWNGQEDPGRWPSGGLDPVERLEGQRLDAVLVINGSPYWLGKGDARRERVSAVARRLDAPVVYANQVGGDDELLFDGRSFAIDRHGSTIAAAAAFREELLLVDTSAAAVPHRPDTGSIADLELALEMGVRDYVRKVGGFPGGAVVGVSGGIDSAVVLTLAARALGPDRVLGVAMPSPFSSPASTADARTLAERLAVELRELPIGLLYAAFAQALTPAIGWRDPPSVTEENVQARIRAVILMAIANREGRIVLGTGNKSELAMGYCTLYGDMAAGLGVIADVPKTLVRRLAVHLNTAPDAPIPERVLTRPPSAELRPDQTDSQSLPPYELLDPLLDAYLEGVSGPGELVESGFDPALVAQVVGTVDRMEYKRRQMALGLKVTSKAFGSGRRMPIAAAPPTARR